MTPIRRHTSGWHAIIAGKLAGVAQSATFALNDEAPKRGPGLADQATPRIAILIRRRALRSRGVEIGKGGEGGFQPAAEPPQRRCLFLQDLIGERRVCRLQIVQSFIHPPCGKAIR
jgi:hypothetical protein